MDTTKKCPHCQTDIPVKAMKCPNCQTDLRNFFRRRPILSLLLILIGGSILLASNASIQNETNQRAEEVVNAMSPEEMAAWQETPSGKLCAEHPGWQKEECDNLVDRKIWVGMSYDMAVYLRGKPDHVNPSNYGGMTKYQYCWDDVRPGCFYDDNQDGIIDAYN